MDRSGRRQAFTRLRAASSGPESSRAVTMPMMPYPEHIEGAVGRYERWDVARHSAAFAELCADAEVMRFLGGPADAKPALEASRRIADHWATFGFGLWAALDRDEGRVAGFVGACRPGPSWPPPLCDATEVGWRLARWAWGRGLATEGGRLALRAGADHLGLSEMIAFVATANRRSRAVALRLGMRRARGAVDGRLGLPVDVYLAALGTPLPAGAG